MKKQFTNPTPIKPNKIKIELLVFDYDPVEMQNALFWKINEIIKYINNHETHEEK